MHTSVALPDRPDASFSPGPKAGASVGVRVGPGSSGISAFLCEDTFVTFLWYNVVAGGGLRSVGEDALPSSMSVCSILPIARFFRGAYVLREGSA